MTESWHFDEKIYPNFNVTYLFVRYLLRVFVNRIFLAYPYADIGIA